SVPTTKEPALAAWRARASRRLPPAARSTVPQVAVRRTSVSRWQAVAPASAQGGQDARAATTSPPRVAQIPPISRSPSAAGHQPATVLRARPLDAACIPPPKFEPPAQAPGYPNVTSLRRNGDESSALPQARIVTAFTSRTPDRNIRGGRPNETAARPSPEKADPPTTGVASSALLGGTLAQPKEPLK